MYLITFTDDHSLSIHEQNSFDNVKFVDHSEINNSEINNLQYSTNVNCITPLWNAKLLKLPYTLLDYTVLIHKFAHHSFRDKRNLFQIKLQLYLHIVITNATILWNLFINNTILESFKFNKI